MPPDHEAPFWAPPRLALVPRERRWALLVAGARDPFAYPIARRLARRGCSLCIAVHDGAHLRTGARRDFERLAVPGAEVRLFDVESLDQCQPYWVLERLQTVVRGGERVQVVVQSACDADATLPAGDPVCRLAVNLTLWAHGVATRHLFAPDSAVIALGPRRCACATRRDGGEHLHPCALESIAKALVVSLGDQGVRVNVVVPGGAEVGPAGWSASTRHPLARATTPADVADVVHLLASPDARGINGQVLHVDGGKHALTTVA